MTKVQELFDTRTPKRNAGQFEIRVEDLAVFLQNPLLISVVMV